MILLSLLALARACPATRAQSSASISGTVTDASGAAVPSANVTATNMETGVLRVATTDAAGRYLILALAVGQYEVKASKSAASARVAR